MSKSLLDKISDWKSFFSAKKVKEAEVAKEAAELSDMELSEMETTSYSSNNDFFYIPETPGADSLVLSSKKTHHSNIVIHPKMLPTINLSERPKYDEYIKMKEQLLTVTMKVFSGYLLYVKKLPSIERDPKLVALIDLIARDVIARFWDMPSSSAVHHNYSWGHLIHSFQTACAEAERGARWKPFTKFGVDQIAYHQYSGYVTVLHFIKGLYHDAYKIYQYDLVSSGKSDFKVFNASKRRSHVLDFKLAYPCIVQEGWKALPEDPGRLNLMEAIFHLPHDCFTLVPHECLMKCLFAVEELMPVETDKGCALDDALQNKALYEKLKMSVYLYFNLHWQTKPAKYVFAVNEMWTAVHYDQFIGKIMQQTDFHDKPSFSLYLIEKGLMFSFQPTSGGLVYSALVPFTSRSRYSGEEKQEKMNVAFISTAFILECSPNALQSCTVAYFSESELKPFEYLRIQIQGNIIKKTEDVTKNSQDQPVKVASNELQNQNKVQSESEQQEPKKAEVTTEMPMPKEKQISVTVQENTSKQKEAKKKKKKAAGNTDVLPVQATLQIAPTKEDAKPQVEVVDKKAPTPEDTTATIVEQGGDGPAFLQERLTKILKKKSFKDVLHKERGWAIIKDDVLLLRFPAFAKGFYPDSKGFEEKEQALMTFLQNQGYIFSTEVTNMLIEGRTCKVIKVVRSKMNDFAFYRAFVERKK